VGLRCLFERKLLLHPRMQATACQQLYEPTERLGRGFLGGYAFDPASFADELPDIECDS
jgi:hypothetical protein